MPVVNEEKFLPHTPSDSEFRLQLSQKEAARILGVSLRTLQNLVAGKNLPVRHIGRRVLVHRKDLEAFARRDHANVGGEE